MRSRPVGRDRRLGVTALAVIVILQTPLVTPGSTVDDPLVGASPAPVQSVPAPTATAPVAEPTPAAVPAPAERVGSTSDESGVWPGHSAGEIAMLLLAALATSLALVGLRERVRVPGPSLLRADPRERPFPPPARTLLLAPGTESTSELREQAAERRFALRVDILVLPVLARPTGRGAAWIECHDATDTWLWHESWLRSASTPPTALEADGLLIGDEDAPVAPGDLVAVTGRTTVGILPVAEGLILSRPAAGTTTELLGRWVGRVGIWRAEVRSRPGAGVLLLHGLVGFPLAVVLPVVAAWAGVPAEVVAVTLGPVAVGFLAAALRWAALDDLDRCTSVRFPVGRGALLLVTAPLHAAVVWGATVRGLMSRRPRARSVGRRNDEAVA